MFHNNSSSNIIGDPNAVPMKPYGDQAVPPPAPYDPNAGGGLPYPINPGMTSYLCPR